MSEGAESLTFVGERQEIITRKSLYYFVVREYSPPLQLPLKGDAEIPAGSPESAAVMHFGAMLAGDYAGWLDSWTSDSRKAIEKRNDELSRSAAFWVEKWRTELSRYKTFQLTKRVDAGPFVVIEFTASGSSGKPLQLDAPVVKDASGKWSVSQEYSDDPVLLRWRFPKEELAVVAREAPNVHRDNGGQ